jgi:molecular chaperone DnaJ/curved DNA-binding protein
MDILLGTKIDVKTVYNEYMKLKIPASTKPGTKFKIKEKGRKEGTRIGDMYVVIEAKMPKEIPEDVRILLESIKYRL